MILLSLAIFVLIIGIILVFTQSSLVVEGSNKIYTIGLDSGQNVYFNGNNGINKISINGVKIKNPYNTGIRTTKTEFPEIYKLLLLNRSQVIKSSTEYLHGTQPLAITGFENGSLVVTNLSDKKVVMKLVVYGEDVYMRSDSVGAFLPINLSNHTISIEDYYHSTKINPLTYQISNFRMSVPPTFDEIKIEQV